MTLRRIFPAVRRALPFTFFQRSSFSTTKTTYNSRKQYMQIGSELSFLTDFRKYQEKQGKLSLDQMELLHLDVKQLQEYKNNLESFCIPTLEGLPDIQAMAKKLLTDINYYIAEINDRLKNPNKPMILGMLSSAEMHGITLIKNQIAIREAGYKYDFSDKVIDATNRMQIIAIKLLPKNENLDRRAFKL